MQQLQVVVVQAPHPWTLLNRGAPPYTGAGEVRTAFLRHLLNIEPPVQVSVLAARRDASTWQAALTRMDSRAHVATLDTLQALDPAAPVVLVSTIADLTVGQQVRHELGGRPWPVVGITHDLSDAEVLQRLVVSHAHGVQPGDAIVCCSQAARDAASRLSAHARNLLGIAHESLAFPVVPHGLDAASLRRLDRSASRTALGLAYADTVFLYFGRIQRGSKADLEGLVAAFDAAGLPASSRLLLAGACDAPGDQRYLDGLEQLARATGRPGRVGFFASPDPSLKDRLFSAADVFVSPANSPQESFGLALLEAMHHALPVIASDWNGYRDIVQAEKTGLLVRTRFRDGALDVLRDLPLAFRGDAHVMMSEQVELDLDALAHAMARLGNDADLCHSLGTAGHERLQQQFLLHDTIAAHIGQWQRLREMAIQAAPVSPRPVGPWSNPAFVFGRHASHKGPTG